MEPIERDVVIRGFRHRILEWDGGGQRTLLCLHGFLDFAWSWHEVAARLAASGLHVVAPDLRGHGDSDRVGAGGYYHFIDHVRDAADVVDAVARDRILMCGHSMGAMIASYYAGSFPERVERLALLDGFGGRDEALELGPRRAADWVHAARNAHGRAPAAYPTIEAAAAQLRELDPRCDPTLARFLAEKGTSAGPHGFVFKHDPLLLVRSPEPFQRAAARVFWSAIVCPTLLVDAAESEYTRRLPDLESRLRMFPGARRVTVSAAGHMLLRHQPETVARLLVAFYAEA